MLLCVSLLLLNFLLIHIHASFSSLSLSFLRRYYDKDLGLIYPFLTAIIDVKEGVITGISFDNACIFCDSNSCSENTYGFDGELAEINQPTKGCALSKVACDAIHLSGGTQCDLQLYVVWTGTDDDGNVLSSADSRFSMFEPKQLQNRFYDQLAKLDIRDKIPTWDDINPFPSWDDITAPFDNIDLNPFD